MNLRPITFADAEALAQLGRESFCAAFAHLYREQDLNAFLQKAYSVEAVSAAIADPAFFHYGAEDPADGTLAAFCKVRYPACYEDHSDAANPMVLCQLYTHPDRTGQGLGAKLMDWALDFARSRNCDAVQLSVWSENYGAQRFYQRYGFAKIADIDFWVGDHRDDEHLLELKI